MCSSEADLCSILSHDSWGGCGSLQRKLARAIHSHRLCTAPRKIGRPSLQARSWFNEVRSSELQKLLKPMISTWNAGGMSTGFGEPVPGLPVAVSLRRLGPGDGDWAAPSTRNPTTLVAGCIAGPAFSSELTLALRCGSISTELRPCPRQSRAFNRPQHVPYASPQ